MFVIILLTLNLVHSQFLFDQNKDEDMNFNINLKDKFYEELKSRYIPNNYENDTIDENQFTKIREQKLYFFYDKGGPNNIGDRDPDFDDGNILLQKLLPFRLPFYGFIYNYIRVSVDGHISFSNFPRNMKHPFEFPIKEWPKKNDPALIAIFYAKSRIGELKRGENETVTKKPGVYIKIIRLNTVNYMFERILKERLTRDIREGIIGADTFNPLYAIIVTWNKISVGGGIDSTLNKTNTYQIVIATDEVRSYAIFNYDEIEWLSDTVSGGDPTYGLGKFAAFVGFNAGNGTRSFEYKPFSQTHTIVKLLSTGFVNGQQGRHIFRIDEDILPGNCNDDIDTSNLKLTIAPESGNMLGGTAVFVTGPCFKTDVIYFCMFDKERVRAKIVNENQLYCIQPMLMAEGYVHFQLFDNKDHLYVTNEAHSIKYYVEIPTLADLIVHVDNDVYETNPEKITISWDKRNLTSIENANVNISLYGYRENKLTPEIIIVKNLKAPVPNNGKATLDTLFEEESLDIDIRYLYFGFIRVQIINDTNPEDDTPSIWSRPIPLSWFLHKKWNQEIGENWAYEMCNTWIKNDRYLTDFTYELPMCPCRKEQAVFDKGRFIPDFQCYKNVNKMCDGIENKNAFHCVYSSVSKHHTGQQQCCYYESGDLILTYDQIGASKPFRAHSMGYFPFNEAFKVPSLSQWYHDRVPYYLCCKWQSDQSVGCETYRFEQRPSQDCRGYQSPAVGTVFGNSHFNTFDGVSYVFYGLGDFFLLKVYDNDELIVQGRFQKYHADYTDLTLTQMVGLAVKSKDSDQIEIRLRPKEAQWRYVFDVYIKRSSDKIKKAIYFDRPALRVQRFIGMTVYTPLKILNQSNIVIVTDSGVGIEVLNQGDHMAANVYLPWTLINKTRGLLGNWSNMIQDDFMTPYDVNPSQNIPNDFIFKTNKSLVGSEYNDFGHSWMANNKLVKDISLFSHQNGFETDRNFIVNYSLPVNYASFGPTPCDDEDCSRDFYLTKDLKIAQQCCDYLKSFKELRLVHQNNVVSCGVLETPRFGKKDLYSLMPGSVVKFSCDSDFILVGDRKRICMDNGRWDFPEYGYTECLRIYEYDAGILITVAIILFGILVPIICFLFIYTIVYYKKKTKNDNRSPIKFFKSNFSKRPDNEYLLKTSPLNNPSIPYDGVYYTNEPLPGKPEIDFEEKFNDLDFEDAIKIEKKNEIKRNEMTLISDQYKNRLMKINPKLSIADRYSIDNDSRNSSIDSYQFPFTDTNTLAQRKQNQNIISKNNLKPIRKLDDINFLTVSQSNLPNASTNLPVIDKSQSLNQLSIQNTLEYKPATTTNV